METVFIALEDMISLYSSSVIQRTLTNQEFSSLVTDSKLHWSQNHSWCASLTLPTLSIFLFYSLIVLSFQNSQLMSFFLISSIHIAMEYNYYGSSDSMPITNIPMFVEPNSKLFLNWIQSKEHWKKLFINYKTNQIKKKENVYLAYLTLWLSIYFDKIVKI